MILISHRGNINGRRPAMENNPSYVKTTMEKGFNVEIDVWLYEGRLYLGHDHPKYKTSLEFLKDERLWCHAKSPETLYHLLKNGVHCFYHNRDSVTLTSKGYIWTYPNCPLTPLSISLFPERRDEDVSNCKGVCSDNIIQIKEEK